MKFKAIMAAAFLTGAVGAASAQTASLNGGLSAGDILKSARTGAKNMASPLGTTQLKSAQGPTPAALSRKDGETFAGMLARYYDAAPQPAASADFDDAGATGSQQCVAFNKGSDERFDIQVKRFVKIIPGAGPLIPEQRFEKVWALGNPDLDNWDLVQNSTTQTDLVAHMTDANKVSDSPLTERFRKNPAQPGLIFLSATEYEGAANQNTFFGYCWRN